MGRVWLAVRQTTQCAALTGVPFNASMLAGRLGVNLAIGTPSDKPGGAWIQHVRSKNHPYPCFAHHLCCLHVQRTVHFFYMLQWSLRRMALILLAALIRCMQILKGACPVAAPCCVHSSIESGPETVVHK